MDTRAAIALVLIIAGFLVIQEQCASFQLFLLNAAAFHHAQQQCLLKRRRSDDEEDAQDHKRLCCGFLNVDERNSGETYTNPRSKEWWEFMMTTAPDLNYRDCFRLPKCVPRYRFVIPAADPSHLRFCGPAGAFSLS